MNVREAVCDEVKRKAMRELWNQSKITLQVLNGAHNKLWVPVSIIVMHSTQPSIWNELNEC